MKPFIKHINSTTNSKTGKPLKNKWFDAGDPNSGDTQTLVGNASTTVWIDIRITRSGIATKLRWYCGAYYASEEEVKIALYNGGRDLLGSMIITVDGVGWFSNDFVTPFYVEAGNYFIAMANIGSGGEILADNVNLKGYTGFQETSYSYPYSGFPYDPLPTEIASSPIGLCMGVYIQ